MENVLSNPPLHLSCLVFCCVYVLFIFRNCQFMNSLFCNERLKKSCGSNGIFISNGCIRGNQGSEWWASEVKMRSEGVDYSV